MGKSFLLVAFLLFLVSVHATIVRADEDDDKSIDTKKHLATVPAPKDLKPVHTLKDMTPIRVLEENEGEEDEDGEGVHKKSNKPKKKLPTRKPKLVEQDTTNYVVLRPNPATGCQRAYCRSNGACNHRVLTCPTECPDLKPKNKNQKGCFIHCGSKCEATCKWRRPDCNGYGALCYDPRFIGGDGVMFYFHGGKGRSFALVSDTNMQINALFIGNRPNGRSRDYTWVQSVAVMFDTHTLIVSAKKVAEWDNSVDVILVKWDGQEVTVPYLGDAEWKTNTGVRQVSVERTDETNSVRVTVNGLVEIDLKAVPITKEDNKVHNYQLPSNDAFAHFETQFRFSNLSDEVEGILGKTYRPGYVSPAKRGVTMPILGGEDKYETPSLTSATCKVCMFQKKPTAGADVAGVADV